SFREQYNGIASVYVRGLQEDAPPEGGWIRGRLSGDEIEIIRRAAGGVPALALMYTGTATQPRGLYPTLVLPPGLATYIVNPWLFVDGGPARRTCGDYSRAATRLALGKGDRRVFERIFL